MGNEKSDCQKFWIEFRSKVLGIDNILQKLDFEKRVTIEGLTKFIDGYIPETRVLIGQKGFDKSLDKKICAVGWFYDDAFWTGVELCTSDDTGWVPIMGNYMQFLNLWDSQYE